jgi:hypothetical protein
VRLLRAIFGRQEKIMDSATKFFIFMVVLAFIIGGFVVEFKPGHTLASVFESNARYYPHINDRTVLGKVDKPVGVKQHVDPDAITIDLSSDNAKP